MESTANAVIQSELQNSEERDEPRASFPADQHLTTPFSSTISACCPDKTVFRQHSTRQSQRTTYSARRQPTRPLPHPRRPRHERRVDNEDEQEFGRDGRDREQREELSSSGRNICAQALLYVMRHT